MVKISRIIWYDNHGCKLIYNLLSKRSFAIACITFANFLDLMQNHKKEFK